MPETLSLPDRDFFEFVSFPEVCYTDSRTKI